MSAKWLAHSAGKNPPVPPQPYSKHIAEVLREVKESIHRMSRYYRGNLKYFSQAVRAAAAFHDLGKLDDENQRVLAENRSTHLPVNHIDAGTALLHRRQLGDACLLVYSHHAYQPHYGLPSIPMEFGEKAELAFRDLETASRTNEYLQHYLSRHLESGVKYISEDIGESSDWNGLTLRIALSCLVDADHGDTAKNYQKECTVSYSQPKWQERLKKIDQYVNDLQKKGGKNKRNTLRKKIYQACKEADTNPALYTCDSPVGTGKTTAVMAHLLKAAINKNLRHIIVVLPYTNIIKQSVDVYRKALVLPGEQPDEVVAEHHHQADFEALNARQLATLWKAPIIVTTAVQFFETIASNHPSKLRKLHELPGSGVFIDETHAAIPTSLWPQTWKWIKELAEKWGCHFVFGSGSLPRFWKLHDLMETPEELPHLVKEEVREEALKLERQRVTAERYPTVLDIEGLLQLVLSTPGPRLVIMNTVQSAAVVADTFARKIYGEKYSIDITTSKILHLSTSLTPIDREEIVKVVSKRLDPANDEKNRDFALIATSCVESGVNFSFRSAFRERAGTANLIQVGGRVRRNNERFEPKLIDFKIEAPLINRHPAFDLSRQVLEKLFDEGKVTTDSPTDLVTEAMRRELMSDTSTKHKTILEKEAQADYPAVAELYKVIADDSMLVLVDEDLKKKLQSGDKVDPREINRKSVQIWRHKLVKTPAYELEGFPGMQAWPSELYDKKFLGYMKGMLPLIQSDSRGFGII
jgi:CRISPR/Cas system-associated endonuclease/helicase Cas3